MPTGRTHPQRVGSLERPLVDTKASPCPGPVWEQGAGVRGGLEGPREGLGWGGWSDLVPEGPLAEGERALWAQS